MTELDLLRIEMVAEEASPGPWKVGEGFRSVNGFVTWEDLPDERNLRRLAYLGSDRSNPITKGHHTDWPRRANATFIASARNDVPTMAAEIRRCWARIAELEANDHSAAR